jgi:hypothetical protein
MTNEVTKRQNEPRDNFDYEPLSEYPGNSSEKRPARSMQGETKLKFVDPDWTADGVPCNGRELVCYDRTFAGAGTPQPHVHADKIWRTGTAAL